MRCIIPILLTIFAFVSDAANLLPAEDYIDADNVDEKFSLQRDFLREFVEEHGSEDPVETVGAIALLVDYIRDIKANRLTGYEFRIDGRFDWLQMRWLFTYFEQLFQIISEPAKSPTSDQLAILFDTIKASFGDDLVAFANENANHDVKLQAVLLMVSREILSRSLQKALTDMDKRKIAEMFMSRVVLSHVEPGQYSRDDIIGVAQKVNFIKDDFDGENMLEYMERMKYHNEDYSVISSHKKRLYLRLEDICQEFHLVYGREVEIFIWSRLLIPEQIPAVLPDSRMLVLAEYERVCLPVRNRKSFEKVKANVKRNMGLAKKIKDGLKSIIN